MKNNDLDGMINYLMEIADHSKFFLTKDMISMFAQILVNLHQPGILRDIFLKNASSLPENVKRSFTKLDFHDPLIAKVIIFTIYDKKCAFPTLINYYAMEGYICV